MREIPIKNVEFDDECAIKPEMMKNFSTFRPTYNKVDEREKREIGGLNISLLIDERGEKRQMYFIL